MSDGTTAALLDFLHDYEKRTNSHSFDDPAPLIADDATYWFGGGSFTGRGAIKHAIETTWGLIRDEQYAIKDVRCIAVDAHVAACLYTLHWKGLVGGSAREGSGRGTSVLRRDAEQWRVIHEHLSPMPPDYGD